MIVKKRVQKDVQLETHKVNLEEMIENNEEFEGLIYKIRDINDIGCFVLIENKPESADDNTEHEEEEVEIKYPEKRSRLEEHLNIKKKSSSETIPDKELSFRQEELKNNVKHILTGRLIVESEGVLYDLIDHETEIKDNAITKTLSIKNCFTTKELTSKEFQVIKLKKEKANELFGEGILENILHNEQIEISTEDIFKNRKQFPITKIKYTRSGETILELDHYKEIIFSEKTKKEDTTKTFINVLNKYETEKDINSFLESFKMNTP